VRRVLVVVVGLAAACGSGKKRQTRSQDAAPVEPIGLPAHDAPGVADEIEPNDNDDAATPLALGATIHGRVEPPDVDHYRIEVPTAGALAVELSGVEKWDLTLDIHDASGTLIARSDRSGPGGKEGVPNLGVTPGRYTAVVRAKKPPVKKGQRKPPPPPPVLPYEITAQLQPVAPGAEREPDDDRGTANDLIIGDQVTGYIGWADDTDVWKLSIEALGARHVLDIEVSAVEASAFTLELLDGVGKSLLVRKAPRGAGLVVRGVMPDVPAGAPPFHYLVLRASPSNPESPYTLRVTEKVPEPDAEVEPNDTLERPMPFPHDRTVVVGHWSPGDVDHYALAPDAAVRTLEITVEPPEGADLAIELLVAGKPIARSDAKGKGVVEKLTAVVPASAAAVLRVRGADGGREGTYQVKLGEP
jgi:hypothetical protein